MKNGFTLIEVVIASFVLGVIVVGVFSFITLTLKATHEGKQRIIATGLANEKMEMIRNLPYDSVGTVGGIPAGPLAQTETIVRNSDSYIVATDIRYIDDPYDQLVTSSPPDTVNTDYKQARVEVSWMNKLGTRSVLLITQIAPKGIEGGSTLGTLVFQALSSAGVGIANASVRLVNTAVTPSIDLSTSTNSTGLAVIPGLPVSSGSYQLTVSKNGFTTEQTYAPTSSFTPDVDHSRLTAIAGEVTNKTFSIDTVSALTIHTVSDTGAIMGDVPYTISGTKKIGTDASNAPVYLFSYTDSTDAGGTFQYQNMVWDSYSFSINGATSGYDIVETSLTLPLSILPGTATDLTVKLAPHVPLSLLVTVVNAGGQVVPNAEVQLVGNAFDQAQITGSTGQVFFGTVTQAGNYSLNITSAGYTAFTSQVAIDGTNQFTASLAGL